MVPVTVPQHRGAALQARCSCPRAAFPRQHIARLRVVAAAAGSGSSHNPSSAPGNGGAGTVRINKAFREFASRREADLFVAEGRVMVNGVTATPGQRLSRGDVVLLDGQSVRWETLQAELAPPDGPRQQQQQQTSSVPSSSPSASSKADGGRATATATGVAAATAAGGSRSSSERAASSSAPTTPIPPPGAVVGHDDGDTPLPLEHAFTYVKYWKPRGVTCTTDARVARNVTSQVRHPSGARLFHVGRLDKDSTGVLLMTSDGRLPNACLRAAHRHVKRYRVTADRPVSPQDVQRLAAGVVITTTAQRDRGVSKELTARTSPCRVEVVQDREEEQGRQQQQQEGRQRQQQEEGESEGGWYAEQEGGDGSGSGGEWSPYGRTLVIELQEGRNRQVRRMLEALGYGTVALHRESFMGIGLGGLRRPGEWRELDEGEMRVVRRAVRRAEAAAAAAAEVGPAAAEAWPTAAEAWPTAAEAWPTAAEVGPTAAEAWPTAAQVGPAPLAEIEKGMQQQEKEEEAAWSAMGWGKKEVGPSAAEVGPSAAEVGPAAAEVEEGMQQQQQQQQQRQQEEEEVWRGVGRGKEQQEWGGAVQGGNKGEGVAATVGKGKEGEQQRGSGRQQTNKAQQQSIMQPEMGAALAAALAGLGGGQGGDGGDAKKKRGGTSG